MVVFGTAWYSLAPYSIARYLRCFVIFLVLCGARLYCSVPCDTVRYCVVLRRTVWRAVVLFGFVRHWVVLRGDAR